MIPDILINDISMLKMGWLRENIDFPTPKAQSETVVDTVAEAADAPPLHKVKKKESLWDIAELWYGVGNGNRYVEIKEFNNLKSDILRAGMVLKIPNV